MATKDKQKPAPKKPRIRKIERHRSFRITKKKILRPNPLPGPVKLIREPLALIFRNKRRFLLLSIIYFFLLFLLTKGLGSAFDIVETKQQFEDYFGKENMGFTTSYALFGYLLTTFNTQLTDTAGTYQLFITIIMILATIWLVRQLYEGEKPRVKDALYKGMTPLVPFILLLVVVSLQLIPLIIGNFIFSTVLNEGLAVTFLEKFLWFMLFILLAVISFYMLLSSIFALNIVTLSDIKPMQALRSARELVVHRRIGIFARIIMVPIVGLIFAGVVFVPLIMFVPVLAEPLFLLFSCFAMIYLTTYMYNFYRKLL